MTVTIRNCQSRFATHCDVIDKSNVCHLGRRVELVSKMLN